LYGELAGVDEVALDDDALVDEVALVTEAEDILELELFCAAALFIPDRPVLVIINPTNVNEIRRTETFVSDLFLCITCNLVRMEYKYIIIHIDHG
jgi:hypothetical protein